jgi:glycosyltransferase involved in cell wall biosynthesis
MSHTESSNVFPWFTVFTATYNRGPSLGRVYESLLSQTLRDFEWLIIDDGSTDDTEARVGEMVDEGRLMIRYIKKNNGGVHTAHNVAIREAKGAFFLRLDSDDACMPHALETFRNIWLDIPADATNLYSGVSCLCSRPSGEIVGDEYPSSPWDSEYAALESLRGEKWGCHRVEILREYPFPEFFGERFCPESLVWARLHDKYKTRCINIPLRIYFESGDSITSSMTRTRYQSPRGVALYYNEQMARARKIRAFRNAVNYVRFSLEGGGVVQAFCSARKKVWVLMALPFGVTVYLRDRLRGDCV